MQIPSSASASTRACTSRAAYGAPEAPVMPRKMRTSAAPLRRLEEDRDPSKIALAEGRERRHGRAFDHAARTLEVGDLEGDAPAFPSLRREIRCAELHAAGVKIGVAVETPRSREERRARNRLRRQLLGLDP